MRRRSTSLFWREKLASLQPITIAGRYVLYAPFDATTQTFTAGPQLAYRHFKKVTLFVHPSIGVIHENISINSHDAFTQLRSFYLRCLANFRQVQLLPSSAPRNPMTPPTSTVSAAAPISMPPSIFTSAPMLNLCMWTYSAVCWPIRATAFASRLAPPSALART